MHTNMYVYTQTRTNIFCSKKKNVVTVPLEIV